MKRGIFVFLVFFLIIGAFNLASARESFQVDNILLKTAIKSNGSFSTSIQVGGTSSIKDFEVRVNNLGDLVSVNSTKFSLNPGEVYSVGVLFSNPNGEKEGIYLGSIEVSSGKEVKKIPVIVEVESNDVLFDSNVEVFPNGRVAPGDKVNAQVKIFDLSSIGTSSVELGYFVKGFNGETVISETENVVVKDQVMITKSLNLPKNLPKGQYVLGITLKYKNSVGTSSSFFEVGQSESSPWMNVNSSFLIIGLGVVFILLIFLFYLIYSRDKVLSELKCQYKNEICMQEKFLNDREKQNEKNLRTPDEKKANKQIFRKLRIARIKNIAKIHSERLKTVKKLKKQNKKDEIKLQVAKWRKQGYDTSLFEKTIPSAKDIKNQVNSWKKKGYNTEILEGKINRKV